MEERMALAVFLAVVFSAVSARPNRPFYIGCTSTSECGKGQCCAIGMGRFTIPTCRPTLDFGEQCRPYGNEGISTNVTYPDGTEVALYNVYIHFCPCSGNLECSPESGQCVDPSEHPDFNYITEFENS